MKNRFTFSVILFVLAALFLVQGCSSKEKDTHATGAGPKYHCPMHHTYVKDGPGDCPICGMRLVPINQEGTQPTAGMQGRMAVAVPAEKRQLIGLTFSTVKKRPLSQTLRTVGTVVHDETKLARVAPRFGGWVRSLQVNYTGQAVKKGDPLFTVYSPELFSAANDYLIALRNLETLTNSPATQQDSARNLLDSAKRRLELLGLGGEEMERISRSGEAIDELQVRAPISGHVVRKNAVEGKSFMAGETLYEVADLHELWVRALVFEYEFSKLKVGQKAKVVFPYLENRDFETQVAFINPHIDPQTRRAEVRLNLGNLEHLLRPDMWANVEIETESGETLAVPASSVIDTGTRFVAFVEGEKDHLEPRELKLGIRTDDFYEVLEGLKEGERVVTRALFLIDSESQLKAAIAGMTEHTH
jgi:Cu(I)/Ag(I) efflux system membrane fusion protein